MCYSPWDFRVGHDLVIEQQHANYISVKWKENFKISKMNMFKVVQKGLITCKRNTQL